MACERCDKAGDLMCVQLPDGTLVLALHADHTVTLSRTDTDLLNEALTLGERQYAELLGDAAFVLSHMPKDNAARTAAVARAGENFRYMRWYNIVSGAVREWMRANGREVPESLDVKHATGPRPTQAPGVA